jgi:carboxyl-terminal processing protease
MCRKTRKQKDNKFMKIQQGRRWLVIVVIVVAMFGSFTVGNITGFLARPVIAAGQPSEFQIFWEAWDIVIEHFVDQDKIDFTKMTYGAIQGMLDSLGDQNHTVFFSPEVAKQEARAFEGSFEGIGAYIDSENDQFKVVAPIHGSPAEAAGILAGDIVLKVDGVEVQGLPGYEVIGMVRGPAGTTVTLTVLHPDAQDPVDIEIVRAKIEVESVLWTRVPETSVAYLQITQFASDTGDELKRALEEIRAEADSGRPITGILLDLRNNPGGLLSEAIRAGSQFLPEGAIILNQQDSEGRVDVLKSIGRGLARDLPMVVLINEGSASAAEILSGALQDHERARLVGMTTVGTGTVLIPFNLSDGSVIRLGVTNWLTPKMKLIKNQGILPDVMIEQEPAVERVDAYRLREAEDLQSLPEEDLQFHSGLMLLQQPTVRGKS